MKRITFTLLLLLTGLFYIGCDYIIMPPNHYVTIYNDEYDKYITAIYYRDWDSYSERWSRNQINGYLYSYESQDLLLMESRYDFEVIMEDDDYSYTIYEEDILVNSDIQLNFCVDCYDKNSKIKIIKTPKKQVTTKD